MAAHDFSSNSYEFLRAEKVHLQFLRVETNLGLTFAHLALNGTDMEGIRRNSANARSAYATVIRFMNRFLLTKRERSDLQKRVGRLEGELRLLDQQSPA